MDRKMKKLMKQFYHDVIGPRRVDYRKAVCDTNAAMRDCLNRNTVDGRIGLIRSGMDCDCTQYYAESVMDSFSSVAAFKRWDDRRQDYLDGPERVAFVQPCDIEPQYKSRDLALMAYEDGHPSTITVVGYDDLI